MLTPPTLDAALDRLNINSPTLDRLDTPQRPAHVRVRMGGPCAVGVVAVHGIPPTGLVHADGVGIAVVPGVVQERNRFHREQPQCHPSAPVAVMVGSVVRVHAMHTEDVGRGRVAEGGVAPLLVSLDLALVVVERVSVTSVTVIGKSVTKPLGQTRV